MFQAHTSLAESIEARTVERSNFAALVDDLGALKAEIAALTAREKAIKDQLAELGAGAYDGDIFRATVSVSDRSTLDMEAVRAKLSPQFITAHTRVTETVTVRVVARTRAAA